MIQTAAHWPELKLVDQDNAWPPRSPAPSTMAVEKSSSPARTAEASSDTTSLRFPYGVPEDWHAAGYDFHALTNHWHHKDGGWMAFEGPFNPPVPEMRPEDCRL